MLDEQQLNGLYTQQDPGAKYLDGKVSAKSSTEPVPDPGAAYLSRRGNVRSFSPLSNVNLSNPDVSKFLGDRGVPNPENTGQDPFLMMGEAQSFGNKLGRRALNLVPNIVSDVIDMAGNVGALLTEWGDERDYHNGLNDLAASIKNPAGEAYARNNDTWAISDPTWWINNAFDLSEFSAAFALGGAGIGGALGKVAGGIKSGLNLGMTASRIVEAAGKLGTSALVSYAEAAQAGTQVYQEVYDNQFQKLLAKGVAPEEAASQAKHIAAQSAATTAQLATVLSMGINTNVYSSFFKSAKENAVDIVAKRLAQAEGTGIRASQAIRSINIADHAADIFEHKGLRYELGQMVKEGGEEFLQQFAQDTGTEMGKDGKTKGFIDQFGEIENIINRTANSNGLFQFVMGAGFGGLQSMLLHNVIPSKRVTKVDATTGEPVQRMNGDIPAVGKDGRPVTVKHWVTPRTYEHDYTKHQFETVKEALAYDFENFEAINDEIVKHTAAGNEIEAEKARNELFDTGGLYAIKAGMLEPWKKTFEKIADMTPEQAVEAGYSSEPGDETYKEKAGKAISDMDHLSEVYNGLVKRYSTGPESEQFIDMAFARHADIYSTGEVIKEYKRKLEEAEADENELLKLTDPGTFSQQLKTYNAQYDSAKAVEAQLIEDHATLLNGTPKEITRILKKYRAVGFGDGDIAGQRQDLDRKIRAKQAELADKVKAAEDMILNGEDFLNWQSKNPGKDFIDFRKELDKNDQVRSINGYKRMQLEAAEETQDIAKKNLADMVSTKSISKFNKNVKEWMEQMRTEAERAEEMRTSRLVEMAKDKTTQSRLGKIELNKVAETHRVRRNSAYDRIAENNKALVKLKTQLSEASWTDPIKVIGLKKQIKATEAHNTQLKFHAEESDRLYKEYAVDTEPVPVPVDEAITGEDNGKITVDANAEPTTTTAEPVGDVIVATAPVIEEVIPPELPLEVPEDISTDPLHIYNKFYATLPPALKGQLTKLVKGLLDGTKSFSLDFFNASIAKGKITQAHALQVLQATKDYVDSVQETLAIEEEEEMEQEAADNTEEQPKDRVSSSGIQIPNTPVIQNGDEAIYSVMPAPIGYHAGYKIINGATMGATSTIAYEEGIRTGKNGQPIYIKVAKPDALNPDLNEDVLHGDKLLAQHPLRYEIDVDYDGPKNITDSLSWDSDQAVVQDRENGRDYLDDNGKVLSDENSINNVPIKVVDAVTGKYLFHIHKMDWITAKFPGTSNYRNVVDILHDSDGNPIDNMAIQQATLRDLRKAIVEKYNTEGKATEGKIAEEGKGTGRLILNYVTTKGTGLTLTSKIVPSLAYNKKNPELSFAPDPSLTIVIAGPGAGTGSRKTGSRLYSGHGYEFKGKLGFDLAKNEVPKGAVALMVPSANGSYLYVPLIGRKVVEEGKPSAGLNTIVRAIELYLLNDGTDATIGAEINNIKSNTGFDISNPSGLRAFIAQYYTYLQGYNEADLSPNTDGDKIEQFLFNIDDLTDSLDKTKRIKLGFSMRGDGSKYANLTNGKLSPEFVEALTEGLMTRSRAVNFTQSNLGIKGINSIGAFTDAIYVPGTGWKHESYDNYNQYVKSFSSTALYGRNKLSDGSYVYTANPHLPITVNDAKTDAEILSEPNNSPVSVAPATEPDVLADWFGTNQSRATIPAIGTGSDNSSELTVQSLEKIYNFTPDAQRNGKTVLEVFKDLKQRGHTYLSEGFNPFSRCL